MSAKEPRRIGEIHGTGERMTIRFIQPIRHSVDHLHLAPPLPRLCLPHLLGINMGMYNIWDGPGFDPPKRFRPSIEVNTT